MENYFFAKKCLVKLNIFLKHDKLTIIYFGYNTKTYIKYPYIRFVSWISFTKVFPPFFSRDTSDIANSKLDSFASSIRHSISNALHKKTLIPWYFAIENEIIKDVNTFYKIDISDISEFLHTFNFREDKQKSIEEQDKLFLENLYYIFRICFLPKTLLQLWIKWKKLVNFSKSERQINITLDIPSQYSFSEDVSNIVKDVYPLIYTWDNQVFSKFTIHSILQDLNAFHKDLWLMIKFITENIILIDEEKFWLRWFQELSREPSLSEKERDNLPDTIRNIYNATHCIEKSPFDGSLLCLTHLKAFENLISITSIFSEEENVLLRKICYIQFLITEVLIRIHTQQSDKYFSHLVALITTLHKYVWSTKRLLWKPQDFITHRKLYRLIFTEQELEKISDTSIKWFESGDLKIKLLSSKNYTSQQKRNFFLLILSLWAHITDKHNEGMMEDELGPFIQYIEKIVIWDDEKTKSAVSFLGKIQPYTNSFSFLSFVIINELENRDFWRYMTHKERNSVLNLDVGILKLISSLNDMRNVLSLTQIERNSFSESWETIHAFLEWKKLFLKFKGEIASLSKLHPSYGTIYEFVQIYRWLRKTEEFLSTVYEQNPDLKDIISLRNYVTNGEDSDYVYKAYHHLCFTDISSPFYPHFFTLSRQDRVKNFDILLKIAWNQSLLERYILFLPVLIHHKDFSDIYDIIMHTDNEWEIYEYVENFIKIFDVISQEDTQKSQERYIDFSQVPWVNTSQINFLTNTFHWNYKSAQKTFDILQILPSNNSKDEFILFLQKNIGTIQDTFFIRVHALLKFFKDFWIKNFDKISKLFEFCSKSDDVEERITFLYQRIHNYELSLWEETEFRGIIMKFIKNGDYGILDDYFFTIEEVNSTQTPQKIIWSVTPISVKEVIRKLWRLWYSENNTNGWGHRTFSLPGSKKKVIVPYWTKNALNKFTLKSIVSDIGISFEEWNNT